MLRSATRLLSGTALLSVSVLAAGAAQAQNCPSATPVWADEFSGTAVDQTRWEMITGDGCAEGICGWGNNELQSYRAQNATVSDGTLKITAKSENFGNSAYTSARMRTASMTNGGEWTHGRFEARIKMPDAPGMWPAFWMLPTNPDLPWPQSGEIDIVESTGRNPETIYGTLHYGQPWPDNQFTGNPMRKMPDTWADGFHTYAVEWTPNEIKWFADDVLYSTKTPADLGNPAFWTFENYAYHFILNLAVGGSLGGAVDNAALPGVMEVDYVRVYDYGPPALSGPHITKPDEPATYSIVSEKGSNSTYSWTAPTGETGTGSSFTVNWEATSGPVNLTVTNSCGTYNLSMDVHVQPRLAKESILEDHEGGGNLTYTAMDGTYERPVSNPAPDAVNGTSQVGRYTRNGAVQYDFIAGDTSLIPDAAEFVDGNKVFFLDVYTDAPVGTEILVQLENNQTALPSNYPVGRHSKYVAYTETQSGWQRLAFELQERINLDTGDNDVTSVFLLIAPGTANNDVYYLDNFDIYGPDTSPPPPPPPPPPNEPPESKWWYNCDGLTCNFNGENSLDTDGNVVSHFWSFEPGASGFGATKTHTFSGPGTYRPFLTVKDDDGAKTTKRRTVTVSDPNAPNLPPENKWWSRCDGLTCDFVAKQSFDPDGQIVSYFWKFESGVPGQYGTPTTYTFSAPGEYRVLLTLKDDDDAKTKKTRTITVSAAASDASISDATGE